MSRRQLALAFSIVLIALTMPSVQAQERGADPNGSRPMLIPGHVPDHSMARPPARATSRSAAYYRAQNPGPSGPAPTPIDANQAQGAAGGAMPMQQQGYVRLGAPMYPSPRPNIPIWSGSTVITNQAFAPQEMLYPHTYRSIYPPYYHRVKGGWILTPMGVRSHEKWELQGTMVEVKYRSTYPGLLSGSFWHPPVTSYSHGARR